MHDLQPMQLAVVEVDDRRSPRGTAPTSGRSSRTARSSQWLQRITEKWRPTSGNVPVSMYFTHVRLTPSGTSCSALHATVQAWQPMHVS